ncbi:hypothetical protein ACH5RR_002865 [Cinchona calisaya]|uniref:DUF4283 domain-containing protein n=1 Tax=Cinchona calisaya TaxID=153742 RepID=A0ABD3AT79_9GENT
MVEELEDLWQKLRITREEDKVAAAPAKLQEGIRLKSNYCLLGQILAPRLVNMQALTSILCNAWNLPRGVHSKHIGDNLALFQFKNEADKRRILNGCHGLSITSCYYYLSLIESVNQQKLNSTGVNYGLESKAGGSGGGGGDIHSGNGGRLLQEEEMPGKLDRASWRGKI